MRSNTSTDIRLEPIIAPIHACLGETPSKSIGGAMINVRATVQPASRMPAPLSFSRTFAAVLYVGKLGSAML